MDEERAQSDSECPGNSDGPALADDLYILKQSLVVGGRRSRHARRQLCQILDILEKAPLLAHSLFSWGFLTRELLYALREPSTTAVSMQVATRVVSVVRKLPDFFLTKKFLFFVSERLYAVLKNRRDNAIVSAAHPVTERDVLLLVTELISIDRSILNVLWEVGFFVLASALLSFECCALYNAVFLDVHHYTVLDHLEHRDYSPEVLYEIQRHYFDAEIVFKEREIIELKKHAASYNKGIYEKIYQKCANIRHIIDLSVKDALDLMLYKRIVFMNDDLDLLIREKNAKAIKFYRHSLEGGAVPSLDYATPLAQALEDAGPRMDAAIALYYIAPLMVDFRGFTEPKIRSIFECLEYHCEAECDMRLRRLEYEHAKMERRKGRAIRSEDASLGSDNCQEVSYFDFSCSGGGPNTGTATGPRAPEHDAASSPPPHNTAELTSILASLDTPADISGLPPARPVAASLASAEPGPLPEPGFDIHRCNRTRVVRLIRELYDNVDRAYFYKPSYLVLMRSQMGHCRSEAGFLNRYFTDFLDYAASGRAALARVLFPVQAQRRARKAVERNREVLSGLGLVDDAHGMAALGSGAADVGMHGLSDEENTPASSLLKERIERMKSKSSEIKVKVAKNVILSDSEDEAAHHGAY